MDCNSCESKKALDTLKVARGQIDGIVRMIEDGRYCIDVSRQMLSVIALIKKANTVILKQHLKTCVTDAIRDNKGEDKIDEMIMVFEKYMEK